MSLLGAPHQASLPLVELFCSPVCVWPWERGEKAEQRCILEPEAPATSEAPVLLVFGFSSVISNFTRFSLRKRVRPVLQVSFVTGVVKGAKRISLPLAPHIPVSHSLCVGKFLSLGGFSGYS